MAYKIHVAVNTSKDTYEHDIPHVFKTAHEVSKAIEGALFAGEGVITSTVLTIVFVPK